VIKARPEDFVVEELADLPLSPKGDHRVYRLQKRGWNTDDLLKLLARTLGVSPAAVAYGGRKDKHGLTTQFITIRDSRDFSRSGENFSLETRGFMDRPMGPDLIRANAFRITIRDLAETKTIDRRLDEIRAFGIPNYFDDQRFRSFDPERGFFALKVLRRHWNGALQVFLTSIPPGTPARERERRTAVLESWKDWPACLELARGRTEQKIFHYLTDNPRQSARALHQIPGDEVSMQYAAYQSHLWNEVLRRLVKDAIPTPASVPGAEGPYLFWLRLGEKERALFRGWAIPTAAARMDFSDPRVRAAYAEVFGEEGIGPAAFRTKALRNVYFKSFPRPALVVPENLVLLGPGEDEIHPGRKTCGLSFALPRGSYATILVKRLML
jgi:tRNA pseudouridine13 synthase